MPKRLLVADDERPLAYALSFKLKAAGYEVETVFDGEAALQSAATGAFDLLLLDLIMPKGGGFEVLEGIKKAGISLPAIVSSNLSQAEEAQRALDLGAIRVIVKSDTTLDQIVGYVGESLREHAEV